MIPLLRPNLPPMQNILMHLEKSRQENQWTNFGPCEKRASGLLQDLLKRYVLLTSNGTTALQLALQAQLPQGSLVAIPDFTFVATLNAVISAGMVPVLFPASPETWAIDLETLWRENSKYDAFIVVQPFGYRLDFAAYDQLSNDLQKPLIYDCAAGFDFESHTTNTVCYSLHATKNLPIGEGGLIAFSSEFLCRRARMMCNFDFDDNREPVTTGGMNAKMDELHAAVLLEQLTRRDEFTNRIASHQHLCIQYQNDLGSIVEPHDRYSASAPQLCVLRTKHAELLSDVGPKRGVAFRRYYRPLLSKMVFSEHLQTVGRSSEYFDKFIAFPSDLINDEYGVVIELVKALTKVNKRKTSH